MDNQSEAFVDITPVSGGSEAVTTVVSDTVYTPVALIGIVAVILVIYVINSFFLGKLFKKAGQKPWEAWVPILNMWRVYEIGGRKGYWSILAMVPILHIFAYVYLILAFNTINTKLKYTPIMTVLAVILPVVWVVIVGSSKNEWNEAPTTQVDSATTTAAQAQPTEEVQTDSNINNTPTV